MNIYFLVEGQAELGVYPHWIDFLLDAKLQRCNDFTQVSNNHYFILEGGGRKMFNISNPTHNSIFNSIKDIAVHPVFDWLVLVVDSEHELTQDRINRIQTTILGDPNCPHLPPNCQIKIIIQNRCFETWLCGHQAFFAQAQLSTNKNVKSFIDFYNVSENDPELMPKDTNPRLAHFSLAQYHANYLHHMLIPNNRIK